MRLFAEFLMSSRTRAVMGVSGFGVLSLAFPPVALLASAGLALVTLRKGLRAGFDVLLYAALACGLLGFLVVSNGFAVSGYLLLQWIPVLLVAFWLRTSGSLARSLLLAMGFGVAVILFHLVWFSEPTAQWREVLQPVEEQILQAQLLDAEGTEQLMNVMAQWMTGGLAAGYFLQTLFALLLGRWWQAMLYNPGGFRQEFHQLRLPKRAAAVGMAVIIATLLMPGDSVGALDYLALLVLFGGFIQGLALVHGAAGIRALHSGWLVSMYLLMVIAPAQIITLLAAAGLADVWLDFRGRLAAVTPPSDSDRPPHD